ncbi:MAG: transcriptional regulator [Chloroflexi bacterium]|nr:transcriptional regulator [Chloroflexota bacterium]
MSQDLSPLSLNQAAERFRKAHFQALLQDWRARLSNRKADLFSYEEVRSTLQTRERGRTQLKEVPLDKIVGSVGRYRDFNQAFLPRNEALFERWRRVDAAMNSMIGLPPVELYQVGELYFVRDGNHRVSVARARGDKSIEAYVTAAEAPFPVDANSAQELSKWLTEAGHRLFLERTQLDKFFPDVDLRLTAPGRYREFDEQISVHRWYMGEAAQHEISYEDAVKSWYKNVYLPLAEAIIRSGLLKEFPQRTVADLYLWICHHREELRSLYDLNLNEEAAVATFGSVYSDNKIRKLFKDIRLAIARLTAGREVIVGLPKKETDTQTSSPEDK